MVPPPKVGARGWDARDNRAPIVPWRHFCQVLRVVFRVNRSAERYEDLRRVGGVNLRSSLHGGQEALRESTHQGGGVRESSACLGALR